VAASEVAELLAEHRVPVAVLNACQSAKESVSESSLAQRLVEAGVPVAVGMAYSVTVTAAEKAMPVLYEELSHGRGPVEAMHAARRVLFDAKAWQAPVAEVDRCWQAFLRRFDLEHTFRLLKQTLGWPPRARPGQQPWRVETFKFSTDPELRLWPPGMTKSPGPRSTSGPRPSRCRLVPVQPPREAALPTQLTRRLSFMCRLTSL
jgi:CHAT domain-containing protein